MFFEGVRSNVSYSPVLVSVTVVTSVSVVTSGRVSRGLVSVVTVVVIYFWSVTFCVFGVSSLLVSGSVCAGFGFSVSFLSSFGVSVTAVVVSAEPFFPDELMTDTDDVSDISVS